MKLFYVDAFLNQGSDLFSMSAHVHAGNAEQALAKFCEERKFSTTSIEAVEIKNVSPVL